MCNPAQGAGVHPVYIYMYINNSLTHLSLMRLEKKKTKVFRLGDVYNFGLFGLWMPFESGCRRSDWDISESGWVGIWFRPRSFDMIWLVYFVSLTSNVTESDRERTILILREFLVSLLGDNSDELSWSLLNLFPNQLAQINLTWNVHVFMIEFAWP